MKHLHKLSFALFAVLIFTQTSFGFVNPGLSSLAKVEKFSTEPTAKPSPFASMTVKDFLTLTPKKYHQLTGKKMSASQKISLKIAQFRVKKMVKQNKQVDLYKLTPGVDTTDFSIGGLALGLILGIIGVLIAYLIGDQSVIKWAWIGFAVWVGIVLLVLIL